MSFFFVFNVVSADDLKDSLVSSFGVRNIEFNKDRGFLLNDEVVYMKGVNIHHDLGCLGSAYYERAMIRRLNINYAEHLVEQTRSSIPDKVMIMTEAFTYYRGKGKDIKAYYEQNPWLDVLKYDYLGEAVSGWPMHGWNCSPVDITGYMRPVAYLHKSFMAEEPMVYIAVRHDDLDVPPAVKGHWDWPPLVNHWTLPNLEGQNVRVYTYTNYPTIELTLNGVSKGKKNLADFDDKMMYWDIPYEPGTIRADCGSADQPVASYELTTAGPADEIELTADTTTIFSNGKDVCHIEVRIKDEEGNLAPSAKNSITFQVTGNGTLLAVDNGNLQSTEPHQFTNKRDAFYGRALTVVKSGKTPGTISLTASSSGLTSGHITINTVEETSVASNAFPISHSSQKVPRWIRVSRYGKYIRITVPDNVYQNICIVSADGSSIQKFSTEKSAMHVWNTASVGSGVYFIYAENGWNRIMKMVVVFK